MTNDSPSQGALFAMMIVVGLLGLGLRQLGVWLDYGDFSVLDILIGGSP